MLHSINMYILMEELTGGKKMHLLKEFYEYTVGKEHHQSFPQNRGEEGREEEGR